MTDQPRKSHRLAFEILGLFAVCFAISLVLYLVLSLCSVSVVEQFYYQNDLPLSEDQLIGMQYSVQGLSLAVSVVFFSVLFFVLFGERLAYIRTIIGGVNALRRGEHGNTVELVGNNELTELARAVNYLSKSEHRIKQKEQKLAEEKDALIRALSHDIRTPLTSIMSYTELLAAKEERTPGELADYLALVGKKTAQIKDLTDILLDAGKREPEAFEDARLLFVQLSDEFAEMLEDAFSVSVDLSGLGAFAGCFDVQEMRRIFDNLISNVQKYASTDHAVALSVSLQEQGLVLRQKNAKGADPTIAEGYRMGIHSMRRIAQNYGGSVEVAQTDSEFEIIITLSQF